MQQHKQDYPCPINTKTLWHIQCYFMVSGAAFAIMPLLQCYLPEDWGSGMFLWATHFRFNCATLSNLIMYSASLYLVDTSARTVNPGDVSRYTSFLINRIIQLDISLLTPCWCWSWCSVRNSPDHLDHVYTSYCTGGSSALSQKGVSSCLSVQWNPKLRRLN